MAKLSLGSLKRKLDKLTLPRIQAETAKIILNDREILVRKRAEMQTGSRPDGTDIGTYRSEAYRLFKLSLNPLAGGKMDWILTGSTMRNLRVIGLKNGKFTIESQDKKWPGLIANYDKKGDMGGINKEWFNGRQKTFHGPQLNNKMKAIAGL